MKKRLAAIIAEEGLIDRFPCRRHTHRQITGRKRLGKTDNVRTDLSMLAGKHLSGSSKPGQYFISNHQCAILITETPHAGQKLRGPDYHAAGSLQHRLNQYGRHSTAELGQQSLQIGQTVDLTQLSLQAQRTAKAIGSI